MTRRDIVVAILTGSTILVGGVLLSRGEAEGQDLLNARGARRAAHSVRYTDGGTDTLDAVREACRAAIRAYKDGFSANLADGVPAVPALQALWDASEAACQAETTLRAEIAEAKKASQAFDHVYECTQLQRNCPATDGGT